MTNRFVRLAALVAALAFISLLSPATASAQWGRNRDDNYGRRNGRISDQERRVLRDVARRINDRSKDFQRDIDRALDNSRHDDTRREDRINNEVTDFRRAAERFKDRAGDSNDLSHSTNEARQLLAEASRVERLLQRVRLNSRAGNSWSQIRSDLRTVADIYNIRTGDFGGGRDDDWGRDRDRNRPRSNGTGFPWPRNFPF